MFDEDWGWNCVWKPWIDWILCVLQGIRLEYLVDFALEPREKHYVKKVCNHWKNKPEVHSIAQGIEEKATPNQYVDNSDDHRENQDVELSVFKILFYSILFLCRLKPVDKRKFHLVQLYAKNHQGSHYYLLATYYYDHLELITQVVEVDVLVDGVFFGEYDFDN